MPRGKIDRNNPESYVTCPLCGDLLREIHWGHLKHVHGMILSEFRAAFPEFQRLSVLRQGELSRNTTNQLKRQWKTGEQGKKVKTFKVKDIGVQTKFSKGINPEDPKTYVQCPLCGWLLRQVTHAHLRCVHGMTVPEFESRFPGVDRSCMESVQKNSERCSKQISEMWKLEAYRKRRIDFMRDNCPFNKIAWDAERRKEQGRRASKQLKRQWGTPEYRGKMLPKVMSGHYYAKYIDKLGRQFLMRSTWEIKFAIFLDFHSISWDYEPLGFPWEDSRGEARVYYPDFKVEGFFVEIKGNVNKESLLKLKWFESLQSYPIFLMTRKSLETLGVLSIELLGFESDGIYSFEAGNQQPSRDGNAPEGSETKSNVLSLLRDMDMKAHERGTSSFEDDDIVRHSGKPERACVKRTRQ